MSSTTFVNIESDFEINSICKLSFDFNLLKDVIDVLVKTQRGLLKRVTGLENNEIAKDKRIVDFEKLLNLSMKEQGNSSRKIDDISKKMKGLEDQVQSLLKDDADELQLEPLGEEDEGITGFNAPIIKRENKEVLASSSRMSLAQVKETGEVKKTNSNKNNIVLNNTFKQIQDSMKAMNKKIKSLSLQIKNFNFTERRGSSIEANSELNQLLNEHDRKIEEINIKLMDMDVVEILRHSTGDKADTLSSNNESKVKNNDEFLVLLKNLEKKTLKKFENLEEKEKKANEVTLDIKAQLHRIGTSSNAIMEQNSLLEGRIEKLNAFTSTINEAIDVKVSDLKAYCDDSFKVKNKMFLNLLHEDVVGKEKEKEESHGQDATVTGSGLGSEAASQKRMSLYDLNPLELNGEDLLLLELKKKLKESDRTVKNLTTLVQSLNLSNINTTLDTFKERISDFASKKDISSFKDNIETVTIQLKYLNDNVSNIIEDKNMMSDDLINLKKRFDNLSQKVQAIRNSTGSDLNSPSKGANFMFDNAKFLEINSFAEFVKLNKQDIDVINQRLDEFKRDFDDQDIVVKNKVSFSDLKEYDQSMLKKMDQAKHYNQGKYFSKLDASKNFKYYEAQIKYIIDTYIKKIEKGDSWIMAKRPFNGHSCASCEHYIGDIASNNSTSYVPYSKIQTKETEKLYRVGDGFSKMLKMINIDDLTGGKDSPRSPSKERERSLNNSFAKVDKIEYQTARANKNQTSNDFYNQSGNLNETKHTSNLPRVKNLKKHYLHRNLDLSMDAKDSPTRDNDLNFSKNGKGPKIVKIMRKNKSII